MALQDGFFDQKNQVIYNRLGITDQDELRDVEGALSVPAMLRIVTGQVPLPGNFGAAHIKEIHRETFKDVYDWAGQTRANGPDGPFQGQKQATFRRQNDTMRYGPYQQLDQRLDAIGAQLNLENNLRGLDPQQFAQRAAYYFDQYNHTHAFREGNGRTSQGIMAVLGREAGYQVELSPQLSGKLNDVRDMAIVRPYGPDQPAKNLEALTLLLSTAITPLPGADAAARRDPSQARPLTAPTPEMQKMEAQRVMQSSAFVTAYALADIDRGNPTRGNALLQQMNQVLLGGTTATKEAPLIQKAALEVSKHPVLGKEREANNNAVWLNKSVHQLVQLENPAPAQRQQVQQKPATPQATAQQKATPTQSPPQQSAGPQSPPKVKPEAPAQKPPAKRRGPKL